MFLGAKKFNGDLAKWDVSSVKDMSDMFGGATFFKRKLCGATWVHSKATKTRMFAGTSGSISQHFCSGACVSTSPRRSTVTLPFDVSDQVKLSLLRRYLLSVLVAIQNVIKSEIALAHSHPSCFFLVIVALVPILIHTYPACHRQALYSSRPFASPSPVTPTYTVDSALSHLSYHRISTPITPAFAPNSAQELQAAVGACTQPSKVRSRSSIRPSHRTESDRCTTPTLGRILDERSWNKQAGKHLPRWAEEIVRTRNLMFGGGK